MNGWTGLPNDVVFCCSGTEFNLGLHDSPKCCGYHTKNL